MAANVLAAGGRLKPTLIDLTDIVGWETAWDGAPFEFVYDLNTGTMIELRSLAAGDAAIAGASVPTYSDIEPITAWAYLRPEDAALDGHANAEVAMLDGSFVAPSVFGYERWFGTQSVSDEDPKLEALDNWPPAGWNGFEKAAGGDASQSSPAVVQKWPPPGEDVVVSGEDAVVYATKFLGTDDDDVINGTTGNDFFNGLGGDDVLNGGPGDDAFLFMAGFGQDVVIGFTAGDAGDDIVEFHGSFTNFADMLAASHQVGPNVFIELDEQNAVALIDVALSSLNQDDFRFV